MTKATTHTDKNGKRLWIRKTVIAASLALVLAGSAYGSYTQLVNGADGKPYANIVIHQSTDPLPFQLDPNVYPTRDLLPEEIKSFSLALQYISSVFDKPVDGYPGFYFIGIDKATDNAYNMTLVTDNGDMHLPEVYFGHVPTEKLIDTLTFIEYTSSGNVWDSAPIRILPQTGKNMPLSSVVMHELIHALGVYGSTVSFTDENSIKLGSSGFIFEKHLKDVYGNQKRSNYRPCADRLGQNGT